jgi:hypothetical protein
MDRAEVVAYALGAALAPHGSRESSLRVRERFSRLARWRSRG